MAPKYDIESPAADPLLPAQDESTDGLTCHATPGGGDAAQHVVHGQDIYSQPGVYRGVPDETDDGPSDTKGLVASVATLLFSLPALGMCLFVCYPCSQEHHTGKELPYRPVLLHLVVAALRATLQSEVTES